MKMVHIVLDSNIIISEGFGNSTRFRVLLSTLNTSQNHLYAPKLSIEETVAEFKRVIDHEIKEVEKGLEALSRRLERELPSPTDELDCEKELNKFRSILLAKFNARRTKILDYPNIAHEDLVKRATARRKPFDEKGVGYRDSLIWETILKLATEVDGRIVLLSSDRDFRIGKGDLHPDLIEDLSRHGLPKDKVDLVLSLQCFINRHIVPTLPENSWQNLVKIFSQENFEEEVKSAIEELYSQTEWTHEELGLEREYEQETVSFSRVNSLSNLRIAEVREMSNNKYFINLSVDIDCDLDLDTFFEGEDGDEYLYSSAWISGLSLWSNIDIVFDVSDPKQQEIEILSFSI